MGPPYYPGEFVHQLIRIFNNTVVANGTGIRVTGGDATQQKVIGNAVFAATPINAPAQTQSDNVADSFGNAANYLVNPTGSPTGSPSQLGLYPLAGTLTGSALDTSSYQSFQDWDRDFNGHQHDGTFRGAYAGEGSNPGWLPKLERKPLGDIEISGTITENSNGVNGVTFSSSGVSCSSSNSSGGYLCLVLSGWSGTIAPLKIGYVFTPTIMTYTNVTTDLLGQDYTAANTLTNRVYLPVVLKNAQ